MAMQNQTPDAQETGLVIAATSHCRNGKQPRWSFLVQGFGGQGRHGMLGTDEQGRGLYLYASQPGGTPARRELVAPESLSLPDSLSRNQANDAVMTLMETLAWSGSQLAA
jgi:hypothetical protein